jgi:phage replication-related protein YjqB (UPF0714/DUF867 family)
MHIKSGANRVDHFRNFAALSACMTEGTDYRIAFERVDGSKYLIVAPHGGMIEPGTSEIAKAIANAGHGYYLFEGMRRRRNSKLHITSHNFDEPIGLELATAATTVLGVHGRSDSGDPQTVYLGGLDEDLVEALKESLVAGGFKVATNGHPFPAKHRGNICNRGRSGMGAQLEIPYTLRNRFLKKSQRPALRTFVVAVQMALAPSVVQ